MTESLFSNIKNHAQYIIEKFNCENPKENNDWAYLNKPLTDTDILQYANLLKQWIPPLNYRVLYGERFSISDSNFETRVHKINKDLISGAKNINDRCKLILPSYKKFNKNIDLCHEQSGLKHFHLEIKTNESGKQERGDVLLYSQLDYKNKLIIFSHIGKHTDMNDHIENEYFEKSKIHLKSLPFPVVPKMTKTDEFKIRKKGWTPILGDENGAYSRPDLKYQIIREWHNAKRYLGNNASSKIVFNQFKENVLAIIYPPIH
ncbi:hypothetical protein [Cysteiniphilum marinum]|uniref:hypothetical protein n=1 Tax=Cysteiniphilum marinum TaxID=2774191 RepID=UPI00193BB696|nr:hypothetical protein [Cysteiniphilum marinum]